MNCIKKSKLFVLYLISVLAISSLGAGIALAKERTYKFINHSGHDIILLYCVPSSLGNWDSDILGSSVIKDGRSCGLWYNDNYRFFNMRFIFKDGSEAIFTSIDFKNLWKLTLHMSDDTRKGAYRIDSEHN